jgi:hypothetical protein
MSPDTERQKFAEAQAAIAEAARNAEQARLSLFDATERVRRADRAGRPRDRAETTASARAAQAAEAMTALNAQREFFRGFSDPRTNASKLDDGTPFLLFPVRLETRFRTIVSAAGAPRQELWVRVYPDDCVIDSFEPLPSEAEIASAQRYWALMWRARGVEAQERAAWRALVASHGSGRAAWLDANYKPSNSAAKPLAGAANSLVLVIPTEAPLGGGEIGPVRDFWIAIWKADGKRAETQAAVTALRGAVGGDARAQDLIDAYEPVNLTDPPPPTFTRAQTIVSVVFVEFPKTEDLPARLQSWSQPARARVLPDRFVLLGYLGGTTVIEELGRPIPWPLTVGPDPQAPPDKQMRQENGEIVAGDDLKWLVDFERAVEIGMGFRAQISPDVATRGLDRLMVIGLRLSADAKEGKGLLEELLTHHRDGTSGLSVLRQGTPTNNTEEEGAGYTRTEEADASFDERLNPGTALRVGAPWREKRDGEWLSEALGIDPAILESVGGSHYTEQIEAQAMNIALWPATLGYSLETMLHPLLEADDVDGLRWFYEHFVTGRGLLPAIRIGRQPYGVLTTSVVSRLRWPSMKDLTSVPSIDTPAGFKLTIARVYAVLAVMSTDWSAMAQRVSHVGRSGDAHQVVLDILGLHPMSVEYDQRYAQSVEDLYNRLRFVGWGAEFIAALIAEGYAQSGMNLLARLGYMGDARPDVINRLFLGDTDPLKGPFVEESPMSEVDGLHDSTTVPSNYIEWLHAAASNSLDTLRAEAGFVGNKPPKALLYLLLRHALLQAYWDSSLRLTQAGGVLDSAAIKAARREAPFIHLDPRSSASESRWRSLYGADEQITGTAGMRVADFITNSIGTVPEVDRLARMLDALNAMKDLPTARLERLFAEHLDTCTYRLDAWQQGLLGYAIAAMRYGMPTNETPVRDGVFLGAFGWLEDVRPKNRQLTPVPPSADLDASFHAKDRPPLMRDSSNGGYVHAPSLNQAVAAAVLRSGYLANAGTANPQTLAVNLSSRRVRLALSILDGIRQGQSLGALLGYQFERGLHDNHGVAEVDTFIYALRKKFPLRADRHPETSTAADVPIEVIEARNVVDGLRLVNHVKELASATYPFGLDLPVATPAQRQAINAEVNRLLDSTDAVADLKIADSVYHAVQSNYDRVAATLESSGNGQLPTEPAVVETPRSGRTIAHRVALHLESGMDETLSPVAGVAVTPRALAEPALNSWLAKLLPPPAQVACSVVWFDPATNALQTRTVTQRDLGLQPIDLLYVASLESQQAMTELDERILLYAHKNFVSRPDCAVTIAYQTAIPGSITFFRLAALVRSLRQLLLQSRPLVPTDAVPQGSASSAMDGSVRVKRARVAKVRDDLATLRADLITFRDTVKPLHTPAVLSAQIVAAIDNQLDTFVAMLVRASGFGVPQTGWGFALDFKTDYFEAVFKDVGALVERWTTRVADCNALLGVYDGPSTLTTAERYAMLAEAEQKVRLYVTIPPPAPVQSYRIAVGNARDTFTARLTAFKAILAMATPSLAAARTAVRAAVAGPPALTMLDLEPFDPARYDDRIVAASADLLARAERLIKALDERQITPATDLMTQHDASADDAARARLLGEAAKLLLGPDAILIQEFQLEDDQGAAMQAAFDASVLGEPFAYQLTVKKTPLPVDTWLYGVARVREKMQQWEQTIMLSGALNDTEPELLPLQVPWKSDEHWLGLEYPSTYTPDGDRLCYTAHFAKPFDRAKWQCGLLIDEWNEIVPALEETTGITFHFDRPNAEAPQSLLLVTPPAFTGSWQWQDIVDAVGETLDRAKQRAVEPAQLDDTAYARFLPMTVIATTLYQISIATNLARNNDVYSFVEMASTNVAIADG